MCEKGNGFFKYRLKKINIENNFYHDRTVIGDGTNRYKFYVWNTEAEIISDVQMLLSWNKWHVKKIYNWTHELIKMTKTENQKGDEDKKTKKNPKSMLQTWDKIFVFYKLTRIFKVVQWIELTIIDVEWNYVACRRIPKGSMRIVRTISDNIVTDDSIQMCLYGMRSYLKNKPTRHKYNVGAYLPNDCDIFTETHSEDHAPKHRAINLQIIQEMYIEKSENQWSNNLVK